MLVARVLTLLVLSLMVLPVGAQESYYRGKTVTFLVGAPPGGGFDDQRGVGHDDCQF